MLTNSARYIRILDGPSSNDLWDAAHHAQLGLTVNFYGQRGYVVPNEIDLTARVMGIQYKTGNEARLILKLRLITVSDSFRADITDNPAYRGMRKLHYNAHTRLGRLYLPPAS